MNRLEMRNSKSTFNISCLNEYFNNNKTYIECISYSSSTVDVVTSAADVAILSLLKGGITSASRTKSVSESSADSSAQACAIRPS